LCIINWLPWFLVACVASKKFERIWFEFEKKSCFKRSLKKKRKKEKNLSSHLSAQPGLPAHQTTP
jgi:hypothetical protein